MIRWDYRLSGVYSITNTIDNKSYFGNSIYIYGRWNGHRHTLRNGIHKNKELQESWDKYGENSFIFKVLVVIKDEDELIRLEQWFIDHRSCYNIRPAGNHKWTSNHKIKGVYWEKDRSKWIVYIKDSSGCCHNLGRYENFEDAAKIRQMAELEYYGELSK